MSDDNLTSDGHLGGADLAKFEAIVKEHAKVSAQAICNEIKQSAPKSPSYWPVALSVIAATVAIIGTLGPLMMIVVDKDDETHDAMHSSIEKSLEKHTAAVSKLTDDFHGLDVTFATLNSSVKTLNSSVEGILANFKGPPVGGRYWVAPPNSEAD